MKVQLTHTASGLTAILESGPTLQYSGDELLVKAIDDHIKRVTNAFFLRKDFQMAKLVYGDLMKEGRVGSIDTGNPRYIQDFLLPEFEAIGYTSSVLDK